MWLSGNSIYADHLIHILAMLRLCQPDPSVAFSSERFDVLAWSNHSDVTLREWVQFLWYYLRLYLMNVFADYHLCDVFHWCEWFSFVLLIQTWEIEWNFICVIFEQILVIDGWGISCKIVLIWMSLDFTDDQSTLVKVMARCHQATSHSLSQCWSKFMSPYGVTRPQRVNWCHCINFARYLS